MLQLCTRFPITWWIRSNIALDMGFTEVLGLSVIPYSASIRIFLNSWTINYDPLSYVIYIGLGYLYSHIVSTKFVIYIDPLLLYCVISKHPVTGSINVTSFRCKFSFRNFLCMEKVSIIYTQSLFHGIQSSSLAGNSLYFIPSFSTLTSVTISYFLPDGMSYDGPVQILANYCSHSIHYCMKEIHMVPM